MKIVVELEVSENTNSRIFDLEDLNLTKSEWDSLDEEKKEDVIQNVLNESTNQPYWMVDKIKEI